MSARDRLRDEVTKGNIWGEPHNLDQLIDDIINEEIIELKPEGYIIGGTSILHPSDVQVTFGFGPDQAARPVRRWARWTAWVAPAEGA